MKNPFKRKRKSYADLPRHYSMTKHSIAVLLAYGGGAMIGLAVGTGRNFGWLYLAGIVSMIVGVWMLGTCRRVIDRLKFDLEDERLDHQVRERDLELRLEAERQMHGLTMDALLHQNELKARMELRDAQLKAARKRHPSGKGIQKFTPRAPIPIRKDTPTKSSND